jgi:hypothetical protein
MYHFNCSFIHCYVMLFVQKTLKKIEKARRDNEITWMNISFFCLTFPRKYKILMNNEWDNLARLCICCCCNFDNVIMNEQYDGGIYFLPILYRKLGSIN